MVPLRKKVLKYGTPKPGIKRNSRGCHFLNRQQPNCRNLIKKPWVLIRFPYMNPNALGVIGPGFLNQVPTLQDFGLRAFIRA